MSKFGIKSVSYIPLCSTEEIKLEIKKPTGNEIAKKMWDKLDDEEKGFINIMIDRDNKQNEEIERLNNILNKLEKELKEDYKILMCNSRSSGRSVQFGIDVCKTHFYNRLQELKGSDKE